jgi:hypothetical protein
MDALAVWLVAIKWIPTLLPEIVFCWDNLQHKKTKAEVLRFFVVAVGWSWPD